jgi:hypothetical protein
MASTGWPSFPKIYKRELPWWMLVVGKGMAMGVLGDVGWCLVT